MAIQTDRIFRIPALRLAEVQTGLNTPAYTYLFTWASPMFEGRLGACHALELGFVFGTYEEKFSGTGPKADALARTIQDAWLAFARSGDPSCEAIGQAAVYNDQKTTLMFGESCGIEAAPYEIERKAWEGVPDELIGSL